MEKRHGLNAHRGHRIGHSGPTTKVSELQQCASAEHQFRRGSVAIPRSQHNTCPMGLVAHVDPRAYGQLRFDGSPIVRLGSGEEALVGSEDAVESLANRQVAGAERLDGLAVRIQEVRVRPVPHHQLDHVQVLVHRRPHQGAPAIVVPDVEVGPRLDGCSDPVDVPLHRRSKKLAVHLIHRQDEGAQLHVLLRVVHHGEARLVCHIEVEAKGQEDLDDAQVAVARGPHARSAALQVRTVIVRAAIDKALGDLLMTVDGAPRHGRPALVVLGVQVHLPPHEKLGALLVPPTRSKHQRSVALVAGQVSLRIGVQEQLQQPRLPVTGCPQARRPAEDGVTDVHIHAAIFQELLGEVDLPSLDIPPKLAVLRLAGYPISCGRSCCGRRRCCCLVATAPLPATGARGRGSDSDRLLAKRPGGHGYPETIPGSW
mmetsp:Transcript_85500/g.189965  ORF Transcript_85500/g.189965 Transcript_85500/m.189965 type:complete len:428 (+) Transcript_85500:1401-2684(+)